MSHPQYKTMVLSPPRRLDAWLLGLLCVLQLVIQLARGVSDKELIRLPEAS